MPKRGYKQTQEHKRKISKKLKGRVLTNKWKKKIGNALQRHIVSSTTRNKMSKSHKGKCFSDEHKRKISESLKGNPLLCHWLGKSFSIETKRKISIAMKGKPHLSIRGKNHPNWNNGSSFEPYSVVFNHELKKKIRQRDKVCQVCGKKNCRDVHHIDYNKKSNSEDNLILLCKSCHTKTNFNRKNWINYFSTMVNKGNKEIYIDVKRHASYY